MANASESVVKSATESAAHGMRKITLWVPDTTSPEFETEYRRQMAILSHHYRETNFEDILEPDEEDVKGWI
jgi:hypothetical protein